MTREDFEERAHKIESDIEQLGRDVCGIRSGMAIHVALQNAAEKIADAIHEDYAAEFEE